MTTYNGTLSDEVIIKLFYKGGKVNSNVIRYGFSDQIKDYLLNRYTDSKSIKETLFRIKNNVAYRPVCPYCGKETIFTGNGFSITCNGKQCLKEQHNKKYTETCIAKYGVKTQRNQT